MWGERPNIGCSEECSDGPALLERDWLAHICLDWYLAYVYQLQSILPLEELFKSYEKVFRKSSVFNQVKVMKVTLTVKKNSHPSFFVHVLCHLPSKRNCKENQETGSSRSSVSVNLPFPLSLRKMGHSGCVQYKATINPTMEVNQHPLPKTEKISASLAGGLPTGGML